MHRIEVHYVASPFAANSPVGENSGFIQERCSRNSRISHRKGGVPVPEKGRSPGVKLAPFECTKSRDSLQSRFQP